MPEFAEDAAEFIAPLNINGIQGRMLRAPSTSNKDREILVIYGHHAMIERWWSLVENLRRYGHVTMPDLPGLGGMESFSKIGLRPDIDAYADYLAAFIKLRYKRKTLTIYAISFGFLVTTRMLQKYPELAKKIDLLISVVGFMRYDDFRWGPRRRLAFRLGARFFAVRPLAFLIRHVALNRLVIETLTKTMPHSKHRFIEVTQVEFDATMQFEVKLWQANDVRTHWLTTSEFFKVDNTKKPIALPVVHLLSEGDHYFDNIKVEQHMRMVFSDYKSFVVKSKAHTPHITAGKKEMATMVPAGLRRLLNKRSK